MKKAKYSPSSWIDLSIGDRSVRISCRGLVPQPGGSKAGFVLGGRVVIVDANRRAVPYQNHIVARLRELISYTANKNGVLEGFSLFPKGPVMVDVMFNMPRPKSHYRKSGELRDRALLHHTTRPDTTKLWRCLEDALTKAGVWKDDAQVHEQIVAKRYVGTEEQAGFEMTVGGQLWTST